MTPPVGEEIETDNARQAKRVGLLPILIGGAAIALIGMGLIFGLQAAM